MNTTEAVKNVLLRFGAGWVLWFLGGLLLVSVGLILERTLYYRSCRCDVKGLALRLDELLAVGEFESAIVMLSKHRSVASSIAVAGLRLAKRGPAAAEKAMESAAALERSRLDKRLSYLGTIGNNAPFLGLFGTVIGVVHAFAELGSADTGKAAAAAGQVASQAVMHAVAEALVATAVGIFVAIPAVAAFNYLQRRVSAILSEAEVLSYLVLAYLADRSQPAIRPCGPKPRACDEGGRQYV